MLASDPAGVKAWHSSCRCFRVPPQQGTTNAMQPTPNSNQPRTETRGQPAADGPRIRMLAIDDNEEFLDIVRQLLEPHGFEITGVTNSAKALEIYKVRGDHFDVVLLDLYMPGLDGGKTCEWLHKLNPRVKVVICSGADGMRLRQIQIQQPTIDGYIHKPFRVDEALHVLRQVLAKPPKAG
jgi:CheY-like chemotaxis protein